MKRTARRRAIASCEAMEGRRLLAAAIAPTDLEQLFLEDLNDARANPTAYGKTIGVDLSSVAPAPPLAFDPTLIRESRQHSQDMFARDYFSDVTPDGQRLFARLRAVGFRQRQPAQPFKWSNTSIAEIEAPPDYPDDPKADVERLLGEFITDPGVLNLHHRKHLLSIDPATHSGLNLAGVGITTNASPSVVKIDYTIDIAATSDTRACLTGVAYDDALGEGRYDLGEGLGGVKITAVKAGSSRPVAVTTTTGAGGYSLRLKPGQYTITATGGLPEPVTTRVVIGHTNVRLDFVQAGGTVSAK